MSALRGLYRQSMKPLRSWLEYRRLPRSAREMVDADRRGVPRNELSAHAAIEAAAAWLCAAQEYSATRDGGVARHFDLRTGWGPSYPETTGYIIPTLLVLADYFDDATYRERAIRMVDWLIGIQLPDGGFQGGTVDAEPVVPVTFNTGQILIGLSIAARDFDDPRALAAARRAARFLRDSQDPDGCWRSHPTPFAKPGEKSYETHVSWGLFEAARAMPEEGYAEAGYRQVDWALGNQRPNGWFGKNCLDDPAAPLTHTIGYVLRGVVEAYRLGGDPRYLDSATATADALLSCIDEEGFMPGRLDADWQGAVGWSCLTGTVQIAACWLLLDRTADRPEYREAALRGIDYVRRTIRTAGEVGTVGGVKGSFPVDGGYTPFQYPNWATKFFLDAQLLALEPGAGSREGHR